MKKKAGEPTKGDVRVVEVDPITHLFDKFGRLVPVPALRLEEWEHIYDAFQKLVPRVPPYEIQSLKITGRTQRKKYALLNVQVQVRIVRQSANENWIRVPLNFDGAVLTKRAVYSGKGTQLVQRAADTNGHIWWIKADAETVHKLELAYAVNLNVAGEQSRLSFKAPAADTKVSLAVNGSKAVAMNNPFPVRRKAAGNKTEFEFDSAGGDVDFVWRASPLVSRKQAPLSATTASKVTVFSPQAIRIRGEISIQSSGRPIGSFRVRLPPRTMLRPDSDPKFEVSMSAQAGVANVVLADPAATQAKVAIEVDYRAPRPNAPKGPIELAGFEVLTAITQPGVVDVATDGDWSLQFSTTGGVQRVANIPPLARQQGVVYRFQYSRFPCSLKATVQAQKTRVRVEPTFVYFVNSNQVRMLATFKCNVLGNGPAELQLDLKGWSGLVVSSTPNGLLDPSLDEGQVEPLRLQLNDLSQLEQGEFEIQLQANRDHAGQIVTIEIPQLKSSSTETRLNSAPPRMVLSPGNNVDLSTDSDSIKDLVLDLFPPNLPPQLLQDRAQRPLYYRASGPAPNFVAAIDVRTRTVSVGSTATVTLMEREVVTRQVLEFNVAYEPIRSVVLDVPSDVIRSQLQVHMLQSGENVGAADLPQQTLLPWELIPDGGAGVASDRERIRVNLQGDLLQTFSLSLTHSKPTPTLLIDQPQPVKIGLVELSGELPHSLTQNYVRARHGTNFQVDPSGREWEVNIEPESDLVERGLPLATDGTVNQIELQVSRRRVANQSPTVVTQSWLQTHLSSSQRRDRAVFRLQSPNPQIRLTLPPNASSAEGSVELALNHRPLSAKSYSVQGDRLTITIPPEAFAAGAESYLLEVWYWFDDRRPSVGKMTIAPPTVEGAQQANRFFWQLVTPPNEFLLLAPSQLTSEQKWTVAGGVILTREPILNQDELEQWIGATGQEALPIRSNRYVYTAIGSIEPFEIQTIRRSVIMFVASGVVLLIGLALIHIHPLRHPSCLLACGVGIGCLVLVNPELGVFAVQSALVGCLLLGIAFLLNRSAIPQPVVPPAAAPVAPPQDFDSTDSAPAGRDSQPTTVTTPIGIPTPPEDES